MSNRITNDAIRALLRRGIASLVIVVSLGLFLTPQAAFADDEPPVFTLPTICSDLLLEGEPAPSTPVWAPLQVTSTARTNTTPLTWQWTAPTSEDVSATFSGYGYALYTGDTLVENGDLTPDVLQYSYLAPSDGTYRLFVWVNDDTSGTVTPEGCEYTDSELDTTPPVVTGDGYVLVDNVATPQLTTTETDIFYSWGVDAGTDAVTISDPAALNPEFTFLKDGTYTFQLTATDSLGNPTLITLVITYIEPFVPGPDTPLVPPVDTTPIAPPVTPVVATPVAKVTTDASTNSASDDASDGEVSVLSATNDSETDGTAAETAAAAPLATSTQGWLIMGIAWYWWVLVIAIIGTAILWYRGHRGDHPDDL